MENSVCTISWKLVENWLRNWRKSFTTVNVNPTMANLLLIFLSNQYFKRQIKELKTTLAVISTSKVNTYGQLDIEPMLFQCWSRVCEAGPALKQLWFNLSCIVLIFALMSRYINPLGPHDALKHHFTSLKTDLIFIQIRNFEWKFSRNWFTNKWQKSRIAACSGWRWQW